MRRSSTREGHSHSLTDLMAGVAAIFLLIAVVFIAISSTQQRAAQAQIHSLEQRPEKVKKALEELMRQLTRLGAKPFYVDPNNKDPNQLIVVFDPKKVHFPSAQCELDDTGRATIQDVAESLLGPICALADAPLLKDEHGILSDVSITLEGHTDDKPFRPNVLGCGIDHFSQCNGGSRCVDEGFEDNVRLSAARAQQVFFELRKQVKTNSQLSDCLEKRFVVAGRGPSVPLCVAEPGISEDKQTDIDECNRRVIIKIRVQPIVTGQESHT